MDPDNFELETLDTAHGVVVNPKMIEDDSVPTTGIDDRGVGSKEKAIEAENRILGDAQERRDKRKETAPGVMDEEDVFNRTV